MAKPELEYGADLTGDDPGAWAALPGLDGITERVLASDPRTGAYTRLLRFAPGADARAMGVQVHDFWEEAFIVEGELTDVTLDRTFPAGAYTCRPPGMVHGPWISGTGALIFEVRGAPATR